VVTNGAFHAFRLSKAQPIHQSGCASVDTHGFALHGHLAGERIALALQATPAASKQSSAEEARLAVMAEKAVAGREKLFGRLTPYILSPLSGLAFNLKYQGRFAEAETLRSPKRPSRRSGHSARSSAKSAASATPASYPPKTRPSISPR